MLSMGMLRFFTFIRTMVSITNDKIKTAENVVFMIIDNFIFYPPNSLITGSRAHAREPVIFPNGTFIRPLMSYPNHEQ